MHVEVRCPARGIYPHGVGLRQLVHGGLHNLEESPVKSTNSAAKRRTVIRRPAGPKTKHITPGMVCRMWRGSYS